MTDILDTDGITRAGEEALTITIVESDTLSATDAEVNDATVVDDDTLSLADGEAFIYGDVTAVRNHPHTSKWHMAIKVPRIVWKVTVLTTRGERGVAAEEDNVIVLNVSTLTLVSPFDAYSTDPNLVKILGAYFADATVWVGSADTDATRTDHGKCRARALGGETNLELTVSADMSCFWEAGDTICLTDLYELWPKPHVVEVDGDTITVYKDTDLASTERAEYPVPVMGPPACAFIDGEYATVVFDGSLSYKVQPDSREYDELGWANQGIASYLWTLEGADTTSASTARVEAHYRTPGQYLAFLQVTDVDGLVSWGVRNVFIFDDPLSPVDAENPVNPPHELIIERLEGNLDDHGWEAEVEVFGDLYSPDNLPNNAQVVLFAEESFGGIEKNFGLGNLHLQGRDNIKMVGWAVDSRIAYNESGERGAGMVIRGLQRYLEGKTNFPVYFTQADDNAPDWHRFTPASDPLTARKFLYHTVQWHWTLLRFTDMYLPDDHNNLLAGHSCDGGSLAAQLDSFVRRIQARWAVDKGGALYVFSWPNYLPVQGAGVVWRARYYNDSHLTTADFSRMQIEPRMREEVARVRVEGVIAFDTGAYQTSIDTVPGNLKRFGGENVLLDAQIIGTGGFEGSQGWELAQQLYAEESRTVEQVTLECLGNYSHFDVVPITSWTRLTANHPLGLRGMNWTAKPFWVVGVNLAIDHEHGDTQTTLTLFPETKMFPAQAWGQWDEVGLEPEEPSTSGTGALTAALVELGDTDTDLVPAILGLGDGTVESDEPGMYWARLWGDLAQAILVDGRGYKPVNNRTVVVERSRGKRNQRGQPLFSIKGIRKNVGEEGDSDSDRAYQTHRGVMSLVGSASVGTNMADIALPVEGEEVYLLGLAAYAKTAPTGAALVISLTRNGTVVGSVSIADGAHRGVTTISSLKLSEGDVLDFDITQIGSTTPGANITVTAVCREYGV